MMITEEIVCISSIHRVIIIQGRLDERRSNIKKLFPFDVNFVEAVFFDISHIYAYKYTSCVPLTLTLKSSRR